MGRDRDWVALHLSGGIGDRKKRELLEKYGGPSDVFRLSAKELSQVAKCGPERAERFLRGPDEETDRVLQELEKCETRLLRWSDPDYPPLLEETYDPPVLLFFRGESADLSRPAVALVGARRAERGAAVWTERMAAACARSGFVVVSGLAAGIDGAAHRGALSAGGRTVAVMGTGPDTIYPKQHRELAERIAAQGALLSELPPGAGPMAPHFPKRNRILAGLSLAVVVVQASERSGAVITARLALEANRELFVVAGPPWDRRFAGNRRLAREGAAVVQDGEEVVLRLGGVPVPDAGRTSPLSSLQGTRRRLAELLLDGPKTADQLCRDLSFPPPEVFSLLTTLELEGVVREEPGKIYQLVEPV